MTDPGECVRDTVRIVRTHGGKFVGSAVALGVLDLQFVQPSTNALIIEKKRTENALFIEIRAMLDE